MSISVRIKQGKFLKNTLIWFVISGVWKLLCLAWSGIRKLPVIKKTVLAVSVVTFVEFAFLFFLTYYQYERLFFFVIEKCILIPFVFYVAVCLVKLQKGTQALASGDLNYVTDTSGMILDLKENGENLNKIAGGMVIAIEDRMKSERMKTELITNVSHDIKTPLTSIINYAALIGNEKSENEKITEYSKVLLSQSERLKRLIEDLVEASKASTGNLDVNPVPCDASVFLIQAAGEYEDRLKSEDLQLVVKHPDSEIRIMADGRRMWRIFDNLTNNIYKYAQRGTRGYLSLERVDNKAVIVFKNTSSAPLDLTEDELMERFTRGDSSRHTEGNGLGLSIA